MERIIRDHARNMRQEPTDAEQRLWNELRAKQIIGHKFRRQAVIGNYIVDFVCYEKKLIVELDGSQHREQLHYDAKRSNWLRSQGFKVLRFWNNQLLNDIDAVPEMIMLELEKIPLTPTLSHKGRGNN